MGGVGGGGGDHARAQGIEAIASNLQKGTGLCDGHPE